MRQDLTRRSLLLGAVAAVPLGAQAARAQAPLRLSGVRADAGPLAARGAQAAAAAIQGIMPEKLRIVFGDLVVADRAAPLLVARIDRFYLSNLAAATPTGRAMSATDSMDGVGLVLAARQAQSATPLHVTLPATYSGAYYTAGIDVRRLDSLCYQFAYWLRREMQV